MAEGRGAGGAWQATATHVRARPARWSPFPCNRVKVATIVATRVQKRALTHRRVVRVYFSAVRQRLCCAFFAPSKFSRKLPFWAVPDSGPRAAL